MALLVENIRELEDWELLAMIGEEAAEVGQAVGKTTRFGVDSRHPFKTNSYRNAELLVLEFVQLRDLAEEFARRFDVSLETTRLLNDVAAQEQLEKYAEIDAKRNSESA